MLDGFDPPRSRAAQIARVLVDVDLPHMDRPLDYVVPDKLVDEAEVGRSVRVRFSGSRVDGWIIERTCREVLDETARIESIVSSIPELTPALYETARRIAARFLATTSQVLCPWCLLITLTTTLVFGGITRINIRDGVIPVPEGLRRIVAQGLDWALWGLIVFGVLAMVVAKYGLKLLG